ncbi:MAG: M23 family metallopeptidase [Deltaproteobacteria bacterium]|nr:M23 family metallopeptidase [Deltaproteobacteria bacterium]
MEVWHPECWELRDVPFLPPVAEVIAVEAPVAAPRRRWKLPQLPRLPGDAVSRVIGGGIAATTLGAAVLAAITLYPRTPDALAAANDADFASDAGAASLMRSATSAREPKALVKAKRWETLEERWPIPTENGVALDEDFPSLTGWIHPVTASRELMPEDTPRWFGAGRTGVSGRPECGLGHCGVDLDGPRGRPIVAVAAGVLVRVEHHELGADGLSGRYVRIQHDDGTLTAYMHMDEIADGLREGDRIQRGQFVGTLGATAVGSTPPHLHFHLEIPNDKKARGDISNTHFTNPAPFLVRSSVIPLFDHRRPLKPAF